MRERSETNGERTYYRRRVHDTESELIEIKNGEFLLAPLEASSQPAAQLAGSFRIKYPSRPERHKISDTRVVDVCPLLRYRPK